VVAGTQLLKMMPGGTPSRRKPSHQGFVNRFRASVAAAFDVVVAAGALAFHERNVAKTPHRNSDSQFHTECNRDQ